MASALYGRDVDIVIAVGTIVGTEDRIRPLCEFKPQRDVGGRDRPGVTGLVTRHAASPVRSEALEKGTGPIDFACGIKGFEDARWIRKWEKVGKKPAIRHDDRHNGRDTDKRTEGHNIRHMFRYM